MTLTPATLRTDLKCGKGAISEGEKCSKGPAQRVNPIAAAAARGRTARRTMQNRYGKPKPLTKKQKKERLQAIGFVAASAGIGVGLAMLKNRNKVRTPNVPNVSEIPVPKPGSVKTPGSVDDLQRAATRGRENAVESWMRGKNPALQAEMQVQAARNPDPKKVLKGMRSELNMLRTELGVFGPNRIKPFKRKPKSDSIYADGFALDTSALAI